MGGQLKQGLKSKQWWNFQLTARGKKQNKKGSTRYSVGYHRLSFSLICLNNVSVLNLLIRRTHRRRFEPATLEAGPTAQMFAVL